MIKNKTEFHFLYPESIAEEKRNRQVPVYPVNQYVQRGQPSSMQ